jgi:Bacterial transglutaminase-like cysteine proteinase BTLCP
LIAELFPEFYDIEGRKVFHPDSRRHSGFRPTFPVGRFLSQPLKYWCSDFVALRRFLAKCKYVPDEKMFGMKDYWQPPEQFEECKKGDCDDFALWSWRQVLHMNYPTRLVVGTAGRYGEGHAWVTFEKEGKTFLLEPLHWPLGLTMPRISTLQYHPKFSMDWNGQTVTYYSHEDRESGPTLRTVAPLVAEWMFIWASFWLRFIATVVKAMGLRLLGAKLPHPSGG